MKSAQVLLLRKAMFAVRRRAVQKAPGPFRQHLYTWSDRGHGCNVAALMMRYFYSRKHLQDPMESSNAVDDNASSKVLKRASDESCLSANPLDESSKI